MNNLPSIHNPRNLPVDMENPKTHAVLINDVETNTLKTYIITKNNKDRIWAAVTGKLPFQIDGVGGFEFFQFKKIYPLTPEKLKELHTEQKIKTGISDSYFDGLLLKRKVYYKFVNPLTKEVTRTTEEEVVEQEYTKEERERGKSLAKEFKNKIKSGKSISKILEEHKAKK